jgi:hypothetical protein
MQEVLQMSDPNFFAPELVPTLYRSLQCSKNKHDNCPEEICECQCHLYMVWHPELKLWRYA